MNPGPNDRRWRDLRAAWAVGLVLAVCGCGAPADDLVPPGRVVLIGIDGADPGLVETWRAEGLLPNLDRLARDGVSGRIASDTLILSPRIWTTVATGKSVERHGVENWVHQEGPRKGRIYRSFDREGHAVWNILSDHGLKVGVINWLITQPPELVNGVMISDFAIPGQGEANRWLAEAFGKDPTLGPDAAETAATTWPTEWQSRVAEVFDTEQEQLLAETVGSDWSRGGFLTEILQRAAFTDEVAKRSALLVEETERPDLLMVLLQGIDRVSHYAWAGVARPSEYPEDQRRSERNRRNFRSAMRDYYAYTDRVIGELLSGFGPDDLVIVLSDHGFEASSENGRTGGHSSPAAAHGVFFAAGPGIRSGEPLGELSIQDVTPAILSWVGLPVALNMDGRVPSFLDVTVRPRVQAYDGKIRRVDDDADQTEQVLLDRLRSLGYIQ